MTNAEIPNIPKDKLEMLKAQYIAVAKDINTPINIEMLEILTKNLGQNISRENLKQMLSEVDFDGNGTMEFNEFLVAMARNKNNSENEMINAFGVLDRSQNGYINAKDLRHVFFCMGENYSLDEINEMLKIIDEDGDGNINFQEFLKIMNQEENF